MRLSDYDNMMGLEFAEYEDLGAIFDPELLKAALVASTAGGGAMLATSWLVKKGTEAVDLSGKIENPVLRSALVSGVTLLAGVAAGRGLVNYNREAAAGVMGAIGGLAMASFLDTAIAFFTKSEKMGVGLGEDDYSGDTMMYGDDDGMSALAALETTGVTAAPGAFQGFADPSVTNEALMGLDGTVVQQETLGDYAAYLS